MVSRVKSTVNKAARAAGAAKRESDESAGWELAGKAPARVQIPSQRLNEIVPGLGIRIIFIQVAHCEDFCPVDQFLQMDTQGETQQQSAEAKRRNNRRRRVGSRSRRRQCREWPVSVQARQRGLTPLRRVTNLKCTTRDPQLANHTKENPTAFTDETTRLRGSMKTAGGRSVARAVERRKSTKCPPAMKPGREKDLAAPPAEFVIATYS